MENKNDMFYYEKLAKLFSNDYSNDENIKPINDKLVELENYIINIDFKTLDFKDLLFYYDILNKILMSKKNINSTRELLDITNEMKGEKINE